MSRILSLVAGGFLAAATGAAPSHAAPRARVPEIAVGEQETILFLGDSITQQNLWTAYLETFLLSRFPNKKLLFWNMGVGGNTVEDGLARFDRDVAARKPTIVLVCFGMNDGRYVPPDPAIRARFASGMQTLVDKIKAIGARPVLLTPPAANAHHALYLAPYNETLFGLAGAVREIGARAAVPVIDLFTPYRTYAEQAKPDPVIIPDGVHPNEAGHLLLVAPALKAFAATQKLGNVIVDDRKVTARDGVKVAQVNVTSGRLSFAVTPNHLPWHVPPAALTTREGQQLHAAWNTFTLTVRNWRTLKTLRVMVDGIEVTAIGPHRRDAIDLARLPDAPWTKAAAALWQEAQSRFSRHTMAWRGLGVDASPFLMDLSAANEAREALTRLVEASGRAMSTIAKPRTYDVAVEETDEVFVVGLEISPAYPYDLTPTDFDTAHPPESAPDNVTWRWHPVVNRALDLEAALDHPRKTVAYARLKLHAPQAGPVEMELGSNDGLTVIVNGQRVLARNVSRGLKLGDERVTVPLQAGSNVVLFRVTQHELRHGLALKLRAQQPVMQQLPTGVAGGPR